MLLCLSSPSFLNTIVTEESNPCPLYALETSGPSTYVYRCDTWLGRGMIEIALVKWPLSSSGHRTQVHINGHWDGLADDFLRPSKLCKRSKKFRIPGYSQIFRWKEVNGKFECTSSPKRCISQTPIATFDSSLGRLQILPTALATSEPTVLIDYLLLTSLLISTHLSSWRALPSPIPLTETPRSLSFTLFDSPSSPSSSLPSSPIESSSSRSMAFPPTSKAPSSPMSPSFRSIPSRSYSKIPSSPMSPSFQSNLLSIPSTSTSKYPSSPISSSSRLRPLPTPPPLYEDEKDIPPPPYQEIQWTVRLRVR